MSNSSLKKPIERVVICGGGNAAHVAVGMFCSRGVEVDLLLTYGNEAERMIEKQQEMDHHSKNNNDNNDKKDSSSAKSSSSSSSLSSSSYTGIIVDFDAAHDPENKRMIGKPRKISKHPEDVIPGACMVLIVAPANSHEAILTSIAPHLKQGVLLGATPAPGGFNMLARDIIEIQNKRPHNSYVLFGMGCLPWVCRISEWGKTVHLAGTKKFDDVTVIPLSATAWVLEILNFLYVETEMRASNGMNNFLHTTFFPTNCIIHPGISYGIWHDYQGEPVKEAPLFYQNMNEKTAEIMEGLSNDILRTCSAAETEMNMKIQIPSVNEYMLKVYPEDIRDKSCTRTIFATNRQFDGLRAPMIPHDSDAGKESGMLQPNFQFRYLTEDLPHGLAVMKGIAEILKVDTPFFDKVLVWGQAKIGHEYIKFNEKSQKYVIQGKDIAHSGCPQRFGITSIEQLKASLV